MENILAKAVGKDDENHRATHFAATVVATSGNTVKVQRDGSPTPDAVFYPTISGTIAGIAAGQRVAVVDFSGEGGYIVMGRILT